MELAKSFGASRCWPKAWAASAADGGTPTAAGDLSASLGVGGAYYRHVAEIGAQAADAVTVTVQNVAPTVDAETRQRTAEIVVGDGAVSGTDG